MNEVEKKCYYGKKDETSDPLNISSIEAEPFDVYSYEHGEYLSIHTYIQNRQ